MVTSGEGWGEGTARDLGMDMYTMPCLKRIADKDPLYSTGNSAQCPAAGWVEGSLGESGSAAELRGCAPETALSTSYPPV